MDGSLVILSLFDVVVTLSASQGQRNSLGILRVFRLLRTLRPLRFVSMLVISKLSVKKTDTIDIVRLPTFFSFLTKFSSDIKMLSV